MVRSSGTAHLTKCENVCVNVGIKELDLKRPVFDLALLPNELIETRRANLAGAVRSGICSVIVVRSSAVQLHFEANGLTVLRWT